MSKKEEFLLKQIQDIWPECPFMVQQVTNPSREVVVEFFTWYFKEFNETAGEQLLGISNPRMYNFNDTTRLFFELKKLFNKSEFTVHLTDIVEPQPKRINYMFSYAINLLKSMYQNIEDINARYEVILDKKRQLIKLQEDKEKALEDVNNLAMELGAKIDKKGQLLEQNQTLKITLDKLAEQKIFYVQQVRNKEKELVALKKHIETAEAKVSSSKDTVHKLKKQIVVENWQSLTNLEESLKNDIKITLLSIEEIKSFIENQKKSIDHYKKCLNKFEQLSFDNFDMQIISEYGNTNNELTKKQKEYESTQKVVDHLLSIKNSLQEKIKDSKHDFEQKKAEYADTLNTLKEEDSALAKDYEECVKICDLDMFKKRDLETKIKQIQAEIDNLKIKKRDFLDAVDVQEQNLSQRYHQLMCIVNNFMGTFEELIKTE